jgi:hypothetical protein
MLVNWEEEAVGDLRSLPEFFFVRSCSNPEIYLTLRSIFCTYCLPLNNSRGHLVNLKYKQRG